MKIRTFKYYVGDFETTVYDGQTTTEVWASALVPLNSEDVEIVGSIDEQWENLKKLDGNICVYYHNLKFDGTFWLDFFLRKTKLQQAFSKFDAKTGTPTGFLDDKDMLNNTFKYSISDMGSWYSITIKQGNRIIEFRDSLKLMPFSVREIGKGFKTKHRKLDMEYTGYRYPNCYISPEERAYIANDVLVVKEALETMFSQGHNQLTIGSCCLAEFKKTYDDEDYAQLFPDLTQIQIDESIYGSTTVDAYIRKSYHGGWCYVVEEKANQVFSPSTTGTTGTTADVNSLYPSMMSSESGNYYPVGHPQFWNGNFIPQCCNKNNKEVYWFVRFKTRFYLKKDKLPFVQIKGNLLYQSTKSLRTSDIEYQGKFYKWIDGVDGTVRPATVIMTMTCEDYYLFREHYDVEDFEILDGCWFHAQIGIFDEYIEKYKKIKLENTGALRTLAKLFLNNLYGKMAASPCSSFKVARIDPKTNALYFDEVEEYNKRAGYIPVGSAITSYAKCFTVRAAQCNFYGYHRSGFIYADTDSIHCDLTPDQIKGIKVHEKDFCCWKLESCWDEGLFVRQKTYIEHITHEDQELIDEPYYNVKCAGMPERCKNLFISSVEQKLAGDLTEEDLSEEEKKFVTTKREITDFKLGLVVQGKLRPVRIMGGTLLVPTTYEMR